MRYQIQKGTKFYGLQSVFEDIQFEIKDKEKIAIVGRNGCGKTTLLKIIAEVEHLEQGTIHKESNTKIGYLAQTTFENEENTIWEEMLQVFSSLQQLQENMNQLQHQMESNYNEEILQKYANVSQAFEEQGGYLYESEIKMVCSKFGFMEEDLNRKIYTFSGGQKTRLAFVKLLLSKPDILLLDEPTNHLDIETIEWLEDYLKRYPKAVVIVSHDRVFLDDVVEVIYELEFGKLKKYIGNYHIYQELKKQDLKRQHSAYVAQQKEIQKTEALIEKFRYKKSKASFAQSKIKYLQKMDKIEDSKVNNKTFHASFKSRIKGGKKVLEIDHLVIGYEKPLCEVTLDIMQGERIAVLGANGEGKSTLLKTLMYKMQPIQGEFLYGHQIEVGYYDQDFAQLNSHISVLEEIWNSFADMTQTQVRTLLGNFLFHNEEVLKPINCLSGGEKVRLSFAKLVLEQPNFLVLDEPTNHLDILGKEALENSLKNYDGTILFVSHDRYFISEIATAILVLENHQATYYPMRYADYVEKKKQIVSVTDKVEKKSYIKQINYGKELKKIEEQISSLEKEIAVYSQLRFEPEYYEDYKKMNELDQKITELEKQLSNDMEQWEEYLSLQESNKKS